MDGILERSYTQNQCDRSVIPEFKKKNKREGGVRGKLRHQLCESQLVTAFALGPPSFIITIGCSFQYEVSLKATLARNLGLSLLPLMTSIITHW